MANSGSGNLIYLPFVFLVICAFLGGLVLSRWDRRRYQRLRPPSIDADPDAWLASWFPQLIVVELFVIIGVIFTAIWYLFVSGLTHSAMAMYAWVGFGIGLGIVALLFVSVDVAIVLRVRAMSRGVLQPPEAENPLERQ